jgi:iron complex outermembrane receptor protein
MDLTEFSIEDLMQVKVVSASKTEQALQDTAAAVFVITADDIRRSGVTHVMDALRLAPGVEVARIDSSRWAISIRGFNGRFANKLLVLIDGRTIYNAQFSGVYWELQDLFLPDIERIEVIRGPGGSLWGANAVNGVINIITKNAKDTPGGLVTLTAGDEERAIAGVRYGGKLGDSAQYRVFGQFSERDGLVTPDGRDAGDDWRIGRGGFRLDWTASAQDTVAVQGDVYDGNFDQNYEAHPRSAVCRAAIVSGRCLGRQLAGALGASILRDLADESASVLSIRGPQ